VTLTWVLGSQGMLGSAICSELTKRGVCLFTPGHRIRWANHVDLAADLNLAVRSFSAELRPEDQWQIFWAAGIGTMSSIESELEPETFGLGKLLELLASDARLAIRPGQFAFASSAGAIYAGTGDELIHESTPVAPTTAYARAKLAQEALVSSFVTRQRNVVALIARISTLYGLGQSGGKQQGFISMFARRVLRKQPIQIYVPFDTVRDYIFANDAAATMIEMIQSLNATDGAFVRIIASEHPTTIAEIVATFKRILHRTPGVAISANPLSAVYSRRIQFRSHSQSVARVPTRTSLHVGIARVIAHERLLYFSCAQK
jgi:UDP-glucose 4-epimerase